MINVSSSLQTAEETILDEKLKKKDDAGIERYERIVRQNTVILTELIDMFDALEMQALSESLLDAEFEKDGNLSRNTMSTMKQQLDTSLRCSSLVIWRGYVGFHGPYSF